MYEEIHADKSWDFPKAHTHQHAPSDILAKGVTRNTSTKPGEKSHEFVKDTYANQTNFKNVEDQVWQCAISLITCSIDR